MRPRETARVDLGEVLRRARDEAGLSQAEAARKAGVSSQTLCRWERGTRPIRADDADRLLATYGRDVRFTLVLRHADLDERLRELAAQTRSKRLASIRGLLGTPALDELQATGAVVFGGAWAAAALGLPALNNVGELVVDDDPTGVRAVGAVLDTWFTAMRTKHYLTSVGWDEDVFRRNPEAVWTAPLLGNFSVRTLPVPPPERRLVDEGVAWRVLDPRKLVPAYVDAAAVARWEELGAAT
jgi:transcriptional regulator with XRE-family HTH domain